MDTVKITLFGIGCQIIQGKFDEVTYAQFKSAAALIKVPVQEAFFDDSFYHGLNLLKYKSWRDLGNRTNIRGLLDNYQSSIEVKVNTRQKRKISTFELMHENVLFPIYTTSHTVLDGCIDQQILNIVEKEVGTIASYKFEVEKFTFEKLLFTMHSIEIRKDLKYTVISKIEYDGNVLKSKKTDTLVKERFVLFELPVQPALYLP